MFQLIANHHCHRVKSVPFIADSSQSINTEVIVGAVIQQTGKKYFQRVILIYAVIMPFFIGKRLFTELCLRMYIEIFPVK